MKITRLQSRESNSSCECGKTTTKEKSFVLKNKIYETRSGIQRRQEKNFEDCSNGFSLKTLNLRSKVYLKQMDTSIIDLPFSGNKLLKNDKKITLQTKKKPCNLNTTYNSFTLNGAINGNEQSIISNSCGKRFSNRFRETFSVVNRANNEDIAVKNKVRNSVIQNDQNDDSGEITINGFKLDTPEKEHYPERNQNGHSNVSDYSNLNGTTESSEKPNCTEEIMEPENQSTRSSKRSHYNRKTNFELFIKETCENLKIGTVSYKRVRKAPSSYSSLILQHKKKEATSEKPKLASNLTLAGIPKKKTGRKAKPKGPIYHYLDLYVNKKNVVDSNLLTDSKNAVIDLELEENSQNSVEFLKPIKSELVGSSPNLVELLSPVKLESGTFKYPITTELNSPNEKESPGKFCKRKREKRKLTIKKKQKIETIEAYEYNNSVTHVLGYRKNNGITEVLVLFDNGTSNWIPHVENEKDNCTLQMFYEDEDQDLAVVNRLGYQVVCDSSNINNKDDDSSTLTAFSDSSFSESETGDTDDVFFTTLPHRLGERTTQLPENSCLVMNQQCLNKVCNYVMSSKNVNLYPCEISQEITLKKQEEFVHIYLKRLFTTNDQGKSVDSLDLKSCEKIITILEECAFDDHCQVVVINGVEDYFASNNLFEKLLRKSAALERSKYEQDVAIVRYFIQTIRNFNKPIVGVIKKTANGLSASILSLFDMVFHEKNEEKVKSNQPQKNKKRRVREKSPVKDNSVDERELLFNDVYQTFIFPRLLGLSENNEAQMMGEQQKPKMDACNFSVIDGLLSQQLKGSIRHMRNNTKIQLKSRSSRSHSEATNHNQQRNSSDDGVACGDSIVTVTSVSDLPLREQQDSTEAVERLQREVEQEKARALQYMTDLQKALKLT